MSFIHKQVDRFAALFKGNANSYGCHIPSKNKVKEGEKAKGKATFTKHDPVTVDTYLKHLHGEESIGIIPIDNDGNIHFAAIDVDVYPLNPAKYTNIIQRADLPLVPFRSKSGGLHLYLFFTDATPAIKAVKAVNIMRQILGLKLDTELFPKQGSLSASATGNFINIPYFKAKDTERYAYDYEGKELTLEEAMNFCYERRKSLPEINALLERVPISQGPPCLQAIYIDGGVDEGARNEFLFNCAIYLKARFKEDFPEKLHSLNSELTNPLEYTELDTTIISSHNKKDYVLKCKHSVLTEFCDKDMCKGREWGIESSSISNISCGTLTQVKSNESYYIWEINETPLYFYNVKDLMSQQKFVELCFEQLHILPRFLDKKEWAARLRRALENIVVEEAEDTDEFTSKSLWVSKVEEFLSRQQAIRPDQIMDGLVYYEPANELIHFKANKLMEFLANTTALREYTPAMHRKLMKELGARNSKLSTGGSGNATRTWAFKIKQLQEKGVFTAVRVNNVEKAAFEPLEFTGEDKF